MKDFLNKYATWLTVIATVIAIGAVVIAAEERYASCKQLAMLELRFDAKILQDRLYDIQQRIWKIEGHFKDKPMPLSVAEEIRVLQAEKHQLVLKLQAIMKKGTK